MEMRAFWRNGTIYPFAVFMLWIWVLWLLKIALRTSYRPWLRPYSGSASVIIPVVDEPPDLFEDVMSRIVEQGPDEVLVVINGPRNPTLEKICDRLNVTWKWTETPGKRNALRIGLLEARGDIAVLVDSDTLWTRGTLRELLKPFRDPTVGGVTTRQRIVDPERSVLTRWADWLESVRSEYSMPAMSVLGTVGCLPGRTIAFRRQILIESLDDFLTERFLGVFLEVSDDRSLTNYTLKAGYRTVYQSTSLVYTDAPLRLGKLLRQQSRWARGSQYNTLRMLPWMVRHAPMLAVFYLSDILVPFMLIGAFASWGRSLMTGTGLGLYVDLPLRPGTEALLWLLGIAFFMTLLSLALRFGRHFAYEPDDLLYLPTFMFINTFLLIPVRVWGFFRMAHNVGWGTRKGGFQGEHVRNPLTFIPYALGGTMLVTTMMLSV